MRYSADVCAVNIPNPKLDQPSPFVNVEKTSEAEFLGDMTQNTMMLAAYPKTKKAATNISNDAKCLAPMVFKIKPPAANASTRSQT